MLRLVKVTKLVSFSTNFFISWTPNHFLFSATSKRLEIGLIHNQNDKIFDLPKLKAFAYGKLNVPHACESKKRLWEKEKMLVTSIFSAVSLWLLKLGIVWKRINLKSNENTVILSKLEVFADKKSNVAPMMR